ncbi:MAG: formylglycine-generating enzyme family protein, partial [Chloroflexi bacterium]|nr:formylglycine-generating enzyme family protein [Chloroflexota bacterium]
MKDLFGTGTTLILNKDSNGNAASGDSSQADVIRFISGTSFRAPIFYHDGTLLPAGYYVEGGNVGPLDGSTITVLPGQGFMVFRKSGSGATTVLVNGQVQVSRLTQYLKVGPEVIGSPFASAAPIGTSGLLESGWVSDRDGSAAAGDWSKASLFRLISGTSFEASVFQHDGSILSPAGWYDANGVLNNNYPLQPGSAYIFSITPTNAVRWRQAVPYEPVARQGFGWIPPGQFLMGSPAGEQDRESDEGPQTLVTLSRGFWIGQHEVTQGEYLAVMGSNPSRFTGDLSRPVEQVSWSEATNYCGKLTEQERAAGRLPGGWVYRLPTKAEWEYAARAGTTTRFSFGDDPGYTILGEYSWFAGNSGSSTHAVQSKRPNLRGLYDMQGNVWEWCWDRYVAWLPGGSLTDPAGPATRLRTRRSPAG